MKVIANWFKLVFPRIVSQEQVAFVAGKNITNNIVIAQEVIHLMNSSKSRKWMAIKIDLEKAYDRVWWDFIDASLQATSIPDYLEKVIVSTISNSTMQVHGNGVPTPKFKSIRGISQRCPLSPYLFILCMKWLGHFIKLVLSRWEWRPIRLSRSSPPFISLFYGWPCHFLQGGCISRQNVKRDPSSLLRYFRV